MSPLSSLLQFSSPRKMFDEHVAPHLAQYMGWSVFEEICIQWLKRYAADRLALSIKQLGRYWSRNGQTEIDIVGECNDGTFLLGECKWRADGAIGLGDYVALRAKAAALPEPKWRAQPAHIMFSLGDFNIELRSLAADPKERLYLISGRDLLPNLNREIAART